jgi:hypothetical protein
MAAPPGTPTKPTGFTTTFVGITYAKATEANIAIANTPRGIGELEEVITPVSLEQGTIDSTNGSDSITGIGTIFTSVLVGQYIYYYDMEGEPVLLGKVLQVTSTTFLTLTANATVNNSSVYYGFTSTILGRRDEILMRIPVVQQGASVVVPYWDAYRDSLNSFNNSTTNSLKRVSQIGSPITPAGPVNIGYTIEPLYGFVPTTITQNGEQVEVYFRTASLFPQFCFAKLNPYGDSDQPLPANALYKLFANENFSLNGLVVTTNYLRSQLELAGY